MVIAIGGVSRSGKTRLTKVIKELLGQKEVYSMCQDDYAYPIPEIPKIKELTDWECPTSINFHNLKEDLISAVDHHDHIILEGFLAFHDLSINKLYDRSIFINISKEVFIERRSRDTRWEKESHWYIEHVWNSYSTYGSLPKDHEALILDGTQTTSEDNLSVYLSPDIIE